jgi:hypothetical protein
MSQLIEAIKQRDEERVRASLQTRESTRAPQPFRQP